MEVIARNGIDKLHFSNFSDVYPGIYVCLMDDKAYKRRRLDIRGMVVQLPAGVRDLSLLQKLPDRPLGATSFPI